METGSGGLRFPLIVSFGLLVAAGISGQTITEFPISGCAPGGITAGSDGALWFTEVYAKIGRITTAGVVTESAILDFEPGWITAGPDGALWFTAASSTGGKIGRITTAGVIKLFAGAGVSGGITAGPDGALWFTNGNNIGRITTAGDITKFAISPATSQGAALGIARGPDEALWFTEWFDEQQESDKIGRITTSGVITKFVIPTAGSGPYGIAAGPDGALWFTESVANKIGRITTAGVITEFAIPTANSNPAGITAGPDGALWFTENVGHKIGRITTAGVITEFEVPSGYSSIRITAGPDGALWFAECLSPDFDAGKIGRITTGLELIALEVIQAVQDWRNSVPLIKDKGTYVRAHIQTSQPVAISARLHGYRTEVSGGAQIRIQFLDSPLTAINYSGYRAEPNAPARRANWNASLNFRLPASWLDGNVELELVRNDGGNLGCQEPGDAGGPAGQISDCRVKVTFVPTDTPKVKLFAINYTSGGKKYDFRISSHLALVSRMLTAIYPIATLDWDGATYLWGETLPPPEEDVLSRMQDLWDHDSFPNRVYFGVIPGPADKRDGIAETPGNAGAGYIPNTFFGLGRATPAHEIGHTLGRAHSVDGALFGTQNGKAEGACGEDAPSPVLSGVFPNFFFVASPSPLGAGEKRQPTLGPMSPVEGDDSLVYGLDTSTLFPMVMDPHVYFDMMSYCGVKPRDMWISKFTYKGLQTSIHNTFAAGVVKKAALAGAQSFLVVRGTVDLRTGAVTINPLRTLTTTVVPDGSAPGAYVLRLLDAADGLIADIPFAPVALEARGPDPRLATFFIPVPANAAIRKVVVLLNTVPLATRAASANPPTVHVLSPNGGESLSSDPVVLSWTGTDPDGDTLLYLVQYSADGGANWETLLADHPAQTASIPRSAFKGSASGLIRVMVTDGFDTAQDQSDATFFVPNHAPFVSLWRPTEGEMFAGDQTIVFEASAHDVEDGQLPGTALQWISSINGLLGLGGTLLKRANQLSPGNHTITATATDSATLTGFASVSIQVGVAAPPSFADLSLEHSASPQPPIVGNDLTYTLQISNAGRDTATGVTLSDTLPPGVAFVSAIATQGSCGEGAGVVTCNLGSLAEAETATITIVVLPPSAGVITNSATVSAGEVDPAPANNAAVLETVIDPRGMTDLMIEKTDSPDPVPLGGALTYTLQVTNLGGNTAMAPAVSDTLPLGTSFVAASGADWSCNFASGTLTCTRPSLGIGAAPPIAIAVTAPATPGSIVNTASVSFADMDTSPGNNSGNVTTQVGGAAPAAGNFYTLVPCRIADTRDPTGAYGGPPLAATTTRVLTIHGRCGIPASAKAVSLNVTITQPTALGHLTLFPGGSPLPLASTINYRAGQTRANNAIVPLGLFGDIDVVSGQPSGTVHFILDVNGYFE